MKTYHMNALVYGQYDCDPCCYCSALAWTPHLLLPQYLLLSLHVPLGYFQEPSCKILGKMELLVTVYMLVGGFLQLAVVRISYVLITCSIS